jgi:hypothetical protein
MNVISNGGSVSRSELLGKFFVPAVFAVLLMMCAGCVERYTVEISPYYLERVTRITLGDTGVRLALIGDPSGKGRKSIIISMRVAILILFLFLASSSRAAPSELTLPGDPAVHLVLDREYRVIEIGNKDGTPIKDLRAYILNPKDGQSSVFFTLGSGGHNKTEEDIATMFEGAKVTKIDGKVAEAKVQWWHYRDSHHLYCTCAVMLMGKHGKKIPAYFDLVANSTERLAALEDAFSKIEFR